MKKRWIFSLIGLIIVIILGLTIFKNYTYSVGYIINKRENSIWVVDGNSYKDAKKKTEEDPYIGITFNRINKKTMKKLQEGRKVRVFHKNKVYASAPAQSEAILIKIIK